MTTAKKKASEKEAKPLFDASQLSLSESERKIYDYLSKEPAHIDQIMTDLDMEPGSINANLISLRLKGLIKQLPGNLFMKH